MKMNLPTVEECIKKIEETDYKLTRRGKVFKGRGALGGALYIFESNGRPAAFREMSFTISELRHAFKYGF